MTDITSVEKENTFEYSDELLAGSFGDVETPETRRRFPLPWKMTRRWWAFAGIRLLIVAVLIAVWQYSGTTSKTQALTISTAWAVAKYLGDFLTGSTVEGTWHDLWITLQEAGVGYALGVAIGIILAVVVSSSEWLRLFAAPFISVFNAIPKIALAPLFILIFRSNFDSKVYFIAAGIFFLSFFNVYSGLRSIDPVYLRNARVLGARRIWLAREVYIPSIVGWVAASLRLSAAFAIAGAVISEYLSAQAGMGFVIYTAQESSNPTIVIAGILIVALTALVIDRIIVRIQAHFSAWRLR